MNGYNFTERVRKVLAMAREEAARLHHEYVGTEHILLGLIREGEGVAAAVLQNLSVDLDDIQQKIEETVKKGKAAQTTGPDLPYTSRAKKVLELAMSEARELSHSYVGTEHLLLGLLREQEGIGGRVLDSLGVALEDVRDQVRNLVGEGDSVPVGQIPFTPRAKKVLELSLREALSLGHDFIGTEHVLLGLARENNGVAVRILADFDVDAEKLRKTVLGIFGGAPTASLHSAKEAAIARMSFEEAAQLHGRELDVTVETGTRSARTETGAPDRLPIVAALVVAAVGFPLGLLVGWLIWA
jgi:ATP-dependent Clp protease ATP-binding subunit ClpA